MSETEERVCTWKEEAQCRDCMNRGTLNCRWKAGDLLVFLALTMPGMLGALAGTVMIGVAQGAWWGTVVYILFFPVVLGVAETRFLCSHCPFYAQEGKVLHCLANHGVLKIWRYHPEPMNRIEKGLMIALVAVFLLMPLTILGYCIAISASGTELICAIGLAVVTVMSLITLAAVMTRHVCAKCVNFSCPFNRVDARHVKAYLDKNPVMKKAWNDCGYDKGQQ